MSKNVFIGTSGFNYKHWSGVFYPSDLSQKKWFQYYSQQFNSVEINATYYMVPKKSTFENWYNITEKKFIIICKANRLTTHRKRLIDPQETMKKFLENITGLKNKMGPVLFQLPPSFKKDIEKLKNFLEYLKNQKIVENVKSCFEFRHKSWLCDEIYELLESYNSCLCFSDWESVNVTEPSTADFVYFRRHGVQQLYTSSYTDEELKKDAEKIVDYLNQNKDAYVFFNNDALGYAVENAIQLRKFVSELIE